MLDSNSTTSFAPGATTAPSEGQPDSPIHIPLPGTDGATLVRLLCGTQDEPCGWQGHLCVHILDACELTRAWREYSEAGLVVFPADFPKSATEGKHPWVKWKNDWIAVGRTDTYSGLAIEAYHRRGDWYGRWRERGSLWLATGQVSKRVVLDLDKPAAVDHWRDRLGADTFDRALRYNSSVRDGFQRIGLHFRIPADDERAWPSHKDNALGYDFQADGHGAKMPPSLHFSGSKYEWAGGELLDAPECLRAPGAARRTSGGRALVWNETLQIRLNRAYAERPTGGDNGRNNWLSRVFGYLVIRHRDDHEGYLLEVERANDLLDDPLDEAELAKTADSIWKTEQAKVEATAPVPAPVAQVDDSEVGPAGQIIDATAAPAVKQSTELQAEDYRRCGYLEKGDNRINNYPHWVTRKVDKDTVMEKVVGKAWSNFDMEALGVYMRDGEVEAYLVRVTVEETGTTSAPVVLPIETLADRRKLGLWLAKRNAAIERSGKPYGDEPSAAMPNEIRLQKYLNAQNPPILELVDHVGWQAEHGVFLTPTGIIRPGADEMQPFAAVRPSEFAVSNSRCSYGTEATGAEAVEIFKQYLTFHEETVASVVGSWLVMLVLRGQYSCSMFPYLHVEGLAESSKTHFLRMGLQLVGQTHSGGKYTPAAAENNYATHANGVIWIDDNDGLSEPVQALIRQAVTGGESAKMRADDFSKTRKLEFRAATVVSSEGLTKRFNDQKANRDRAIRLKFPKVVDRPSLIDPSRLQWADIRALWMDRWGKDFTRVAGSLVSAILALAAEVEIAPEAKRTHQGLAIVQAGAKILTKLTADSEHQARVDKWVAGQIKNDLGNASLVTLEVIPTVHRHELFPQSPRGNGIAVAVYWDPTAGTYHVNAELTADRWRTINRGSNSSRTESLTDATAITRELDAIGAGKSTSRRTGLAAEQGKSVLRYREIPATYSPVIERTARG